MDRRFYDLDIQSDRSSGDDPVDALADRAERLGFDGIAIADYAVDQDDVQATAQAIAETDTDLAIHLGVKLKPEDVEELNAMLQRFRDRVEVVIVHGGDVAVNRAATEDTRVDILAHPGQGRNDAGLDHVMAKQAASNQVAIQIAVGRLLATYGKVRAHVLAHMRRQVRLCTHANAPIIASSAADAVAGLRAPRELAAFPRILGMGVEGSFDTVSTTPHTIVQRADEVTGDAFVRPGVEVATGE